MRRAIQPFPDARFIARVAIGQARLAQNRMLKGDILFGVVQQARRLYQPVFDDRVLLRQIQDTLADLPKRPRCLALPAHLFALIRQHGRSPLRTQGAGRIGGGARGVFCQPCHRQLPTFCWGYRDLSTGTLVRKPRALWYAWHGHFGTQTYN